MKEVSDLKNFTRGGQVTLHNIRMFIQITNKVALVGAGIFCCLFIVLAWILTTPYERYVMAKFAESSLISLVNPEARTYFIEPNGEKANVKFTDIQTAPLINEVKREVAGKLLLDFLTALILTTLSLWGVAVWLKRRGVKQTENMLLNGDHILSKEKTTLLIKKQKLHSDLTLATLPLIKGKETSHLLFHGTVGSGKSTAIKELLDQIRRRGDRVIIYDKGCNFLEEFYQADSDVLLNPMDNRGESWHLWNECRDSADYDNLAAAQIPMPLSTADPFWVNAARTIFSAAAFEMRHDPDRSVMKLLRYLLTADLELLQTYLKGTVAETLVSEKIEKTAISIKSVLATYLKSMKYIKDEANPFSIREWIQDEKANNWLFITSLGDRHETLKPLITAWLDIAVNALLSLSPDANRRIWLVLDELTSLQQVPYLTQTLAESRKFGGCAIVGIQNIAQLQKLYGQDGARDISSLINTRAMFRQPDPDIAKWSAQNFGETITDEVREGISYGANTMRDGVSINRVETRKPAVSYSEIMSLSDLTAYIRLPGAFPITSIELQYQKRKKINEGFILRAFDEKKMQEMDQIIDVCVKPISSVPDEDQAHAHALDNNDHKSTAQAELQNTNYNQIKNKKIKKKRKSTINTKSKIDAKDIDNTVSPDAFASFDEMLTM
jgi:type IV conjugative transfer system coupling protein TraD